MSSFSRFTFTYLALVSPPVALAMDVFARSLAEIGRADDEDLEALRPGLVASPGTGRDAHRVPFLELDDLVVDLHPSTPAEDHVHLLLLLVRVAVRKAIAGRDALVAQAGFLELERLGRPAKLQVRRAIEPRADVSQVLPEVPEREWHGVILWHPWLGSPDLMSQAPPRHVPSPRRSPVITRRLDRRERRAARRCALDARSEVSSGLTPAKAAGQALPARPLHADGGRAPRATDASCRT